MRYALEHQKMGEEGYLIPEIKADVIPLIGIKGVQEFSAISRIFLAKSLVQTGNVRFVFLEEAHTSKKESSLEIIKVQWLKKHLEQSPSVYVLFYNLELLYANFENTSNDIYAEISHYRSSKNTVALILIQPPSLSAFGENTLEMVKILCSKCELASDELFVLSLNSSHSCDQIVERLVNALITLSSRTYENRIKKLKHALTTLSGPSSVWHLFKIGFYEEMIKQLHNALTTYKQACSELLTLSDINTDKFLRTLALISLKVCSLYFKINSPSEAISFFHRYLDRYESSKESKFDFLIAFGFLFEKFIALGTVTPLRSSHPGLYFAAAISLSPRRVNSLIINKATENFKYTGSLRFYWQFKARYALMQGESKLNDAVTAIMELKTLDPSWPFLDLLSQAKALAKNHLHEFILISLLSADISAIKRALALHLPKQFFVSHEYTRFCGIRVDIAFSRGFADLFTGLNLTVLLSVDLDLSSAVVHFNISELDNHVNIKKSCSSFSLTVVSEQRTDISFIKVETIDLYVGSCILSFRPFSVPNSIHQLPYDVTTSNTNMKEEIEIVLEQDKCPYINEIQTVQLKIISKYVLSNVSVTVKKLTERIYFHSASTLAPDISFYSFKEVSKTSKYFDYLMHISVSEKEQYISVTVQYKQELNDLILVRKIGVSGIYPFAISAMPYSLANFCVLEDVDCYKDFLLIAELKSEADKTLVICSCQIESNEHLSTHPVYFDPYFIEPGEVFKISFYCKVASEHLPGEKIPYLVSVVYKIASFSAPECYLSLPCTALNTVGNVLQCSVSIPSFCVLHQCFEVNLSLINCTEKAKEFLLFVEQSPDFLFSGKSSFEILMPPHGTFCYNFSLLPTHIGFSKLPVVYYKEGKNTRADVIACIPKLIFCTQNLINNHVPTTVQL